MTDITSKKIVNILSVDEAKFSLNFMIGTIIGSFNKHYTAFSPDVNTVFIYENNANWSFIINIFRDPKIAKLISKPNMALTVFLHGNYANNIDHISNYLNNKNSARYVPTMKQEISNQDLIPSFQERVANVALIMSKYKDQADKTIKNLGIQRSYFNKNRDCYLLYLTAFNDILSNRGPVKFIDLVSYVRKYPFLYRTNISPGYALDVLIKMGSLSIDSHTTVVSIPDQIPI